VPKSKKSKAIKKTKKQTAAPAKLPFKKFDNIEEPFTPYKSLLEIPATDIDGKKIKKLGDILKGKKLVLIVNVASKCGLTSSNYKFLHEIYSKYSIKGLEILAFPCN
jgi:glutathione peroxidase